MPVKKISRPKTVNEILLDEDIKRAIWLEGVKKIEQRRIVAFLEKELLPDLVKRVAQLEALAARGQQTAIQRLKTIKNLIARAKETIKQVTGKAYTQSKGRFEKIADQEVSWQVNTLNAVAGEFGLEFGTPATALVRAIVSSKPMDGKPLRQWFSDLSRTVQGNFEKVVRVGVAEGESVPKMVQRIRKVVDMSKVHASTVVRTAVNHVTNYANELVYDENQDIVKGVMYVATLDSRTSAICASLDGKVFDLNEGPRPPQHPNCRSRTVPVLKSWKELGIDLKEAPEGTRASMDGQVPASLTYSDWLKDQSESVQNTVLGVGKASLFRRGKLSAKRFAEPLSNVRR